jgi:cytochrome c553
MGGVYITESKPSIQGLKESYLERRIKEYMEMTNLKYTGAKRKYYNETF